MDIDIGIKKKDREAIAEGLSRLLADTYTLYLKTHNFPGKMLSYMQAGKPILASINPGNDLGEIVMDSGSGYACSNEDDALLHRYARELTRDSNLRRRMGENARKLLVDKFDVAVAARQITAHFSAARPA